MKIRFGDMRWPEIEEVLRKPHVVILPIGSTEQHGRHLPVNFDSYSAMYIGEQAARRVTDEYEIHVLVAPTIPYSETFGRPPFDQLLPGNICISPDTIIRLVEEVTRSLVNQGFKNILVLNSHVENTAPIAVALRKVSIESKDAGLYAVNWFLLASEARSTICKDGKAGLGHACELETAMALAIEPENVRLDAVVKGSQSFSLPEKYITPAPFGPVFYHSRLGGVRVSGVMGDPSTANEETGRKCIAAFVDDLTEIILSIAKSESMTFEEKP
ncbi:creatininase family protein [Chloroflexota bacterium]